MSESAPSDDSAADDNRADDDEDLASSRSEAVPVDPDANDDIIASAGETADAGFESETLEFEPPGEMAIAPPDYDYKVQLDIFEGPLDLLLYLIKREEVDIYDISIERITKQYLEYIETFRILNIGLAGEFLVMAANLCYIKSRTLLPRHQQPPEEDAEEEDPRWDLIRQLIEYKKFKEAATYLHRRETEQQAIFRNVPEKIETKDDGERPLAEVSIFDLIRAFQKILERFGEDDGRGEIVDEPFTVADKIDHLLKTIPSGVSVRFSTLFENASSKGEVIVTFLALLELMKLNHFVVRQETLLGEIELRRNDGNDG